MAKSNFVKLESKKTDLGIQNLTVEVGIISLCDRSGRVIVNKNLDQPIVLKVGERVQVSYVFTERDALSLIFKERQKAPRGSRRRLKGTGGVDVSETNRDTLG